MTAADPEGRIRHLLDVMHRTHDAAGDPIPAGYVPVADGLGQVDYVDSATFGSTAELEATVFGYQAHGSLGSTETFDSTVAGWHSGTVNADCTFTFTAYASGTVSSMVLELTQDGTGGWNLTLPGSVVGDFSGYDTTAGTTSLLMFFSRDGGTTWFGFIAGGSGTAVAALDDLTDVTITTPASGDLLTYNGSVWVNQAPSTTVAGEIVIASVHSTPLVFDDLVQNSDGDDLVYASA